MALWPVRRRRSRDAAPARTELPAQFRFRRQPSLMSRAEARCYAFLLRTYAPRYHIGFKLDFVHFREGKNKAGNLTGVRSR